MSDTVLESKTAYFHLPGLFEFFEFYEAFLPVYEECPEYFYDWAKIASIYGAPDGCIWSGGRLESGESDIKKVLGLLKRYNLSARLTFSNSLLTKEHLSDRKCNSLCRALSEGNEKENGVIIYSDLLLNYIREKYPKLYLVSSTTKVITDYDRFLEELGREEFSYVVPDFRLNKSFNRLNELKPEEKDKVEFLCNECCYVGCADRKACYENVSRQILDENVSDFPCKAPGGSEGYVFSKAMTNPMFISINDIQDKYLENGFSNFKIEGRSLGSALLLEFILYYMVKPEYHLHVREKIYLDSMLNLF